MLLRPPPPSARSSGGTRRPQLSPAWTACAKGRAGSLGRYERRSAGPDAKAVERSKRSSRGSPPAARPDWNGSPSTPTGTLARISGRSSSRNLIDAFIGLAGCSVPCWWYGGGLAAETKQFRGAAAGEMDPPPRLRGGDRFGLGADGTSSQAEAACGREGGAGVSVLPFLFCSCLSRVITGGVPSASALAPSGETTTGWEAAAACSSSADGEAVLHAN